MDKTKNAIVYTKVRDIKGVHKQQEIRHHIGKNGFEPREWQIVMAWAEIGKEAVFFHNGSQSETCTGMYWYQCYGNANDVNGWWGMTHGEPFLLRSFAGKVDKLVAAVADMLAGKEVIVPCMVDGNKDDLKTGKAQHPALQGEPETRRLQPEARLRRLGRRGLPPAVGHARLHAHLFPAARRSRRPVHRQRRLQRRRQARSLPRRGRPRRAAAERRRVPQRD